MMRTGRILLVEPEDDFRRDLDRQLDLAGHDVASVPDEDAAARLLEEGLDPDVVVVDSDDTAGTGALRELAPRAVLLRIDRALDHGKDFDSRVGELARCAPDPGDVLRRVEELLLRHHPPSGTGPGSRCLDLARRLANALPRASTVEERIDLVTESFDTFFGVRGTLVVRRGLADDSWIEATQGMSGAVAQRIGEEITLRSRSRDIRPFLTRLTVEDETHEVACLALTLAQDEEVDLALDLERAPSQPGQRASLMNLVGSAVRASATAEELERSRSLMEAQGTSINALLDTTRELTTITNRSLLCRRILAILRAELSMTCSALFEPREDVHGLLKMTASDGFAAELLERTGLSRVHGVGRAGLASTELQAISEVDSETAARERELLDEVGLRWVIPIELDDERSGLVFFGRPGGAIGLEPWERQLLSAVLASAGAALRSLSRLDELAELSAGSLRGLVAAAELGNPWDRGHAERVARTAVRVGRALGMRERTLRDLSLAAILHEVGKIGGGADPERAERMHPGIGSTILARGRYSPDVVQGVEQHQERFDGEGFPYGLSGETIHVFGRILAIADAYDRLTRASERPLPPEEALARIERGAGLLYDPGLVAMFLEEIGREADTDPPSAIWLRQIVGADEPD